MGFSHLPRVVDNLVASFVWRADGDPRNTLARPLAPGESADVFAEAHNFSRLLGTLRSDRKVELWAAFGNEDRVPPRGDPVLCRPFERCDLLCDEVRQRWLAVDPWLPEGSRGFFPVGGDGLRAITDEDLPDLDYEGAGPPHLYDPAQRVPADRFFVPIYGRWIRARVTCVDNFPTTALACYLRGSCW